MPDNGYPSDWNLEKKAYTPSIPAVSTWDRILYSASSHWILVWGFFFGLYVSLPFLAPVLMRLGWAGGGKAIYLIYSFFCHQLPQRSFFLFGPKVMLSLSEIQSAWQQTLNPLVLRQFIGNPAMGWKVAWSDRMVSMFTSTWLFGLIWWPFRKKIGKLPWWGVALFLLPMALDGGTHMLADLAGLGQGFRDSNAWLAALTQNTLPASFYTGDALGSFNSWMRLLSGILFGAGAVWFGYPYLDEAFSMTAATFRQKMGTYREVSNG